MSLTPYPTLRLKLTQPQALKLQFLPAVPGSNAAAAAAQAAQSAAQAEQAAQDAINATAGKVSKSGDVMTGFLTLNADPGSALQAATKQYVDSHIASGTISAVTPPTITGGHLAGFSDATGTHIREIKVGPTMSIDGTFTLNTTAGGGNVMAIGTPASGQYAQWTSAVQIQGRTAAQVLTDIGAQPLDGDLTAVAALTGTNTIYYRSAADTWSPVVMGGNMTFSGGVLNSTGAGGGGNVSNVGTPINGQLAQWTDATHIQGIAASSLGFGNVSNTGTPAVNQIAQWTDATHVQGITGTQTTALLDVFTSTLKGVAPASGGGTTNFLRADATWAAPAGGGGSGGATISDTPPASPTQGQLWWESDSGGLWISYNDGNSTQWVSATASGTAAPTSGSRVLIQTQTVSSPVATLAFTVGLDSTYDEYEVRAYGVKAATDNQNINLRISQDGGSTWKSGATDYTFTRYQHYADTSSASVTVGSGSAGANSVILSPGIYGGSVSLQNAQFDFTFANPSVAGIRKHFKGSGAGHNPSGGLAYWTLAAAYWGDTNAFNGLQFSMSSGNIFAGTFKLYGIVK